MRNDGFSKLHPLTNFIFFLGAIGFGVVFQHPVYLATGIAAGALYYSLLLGRKVGKPLVAMLPLFLLVTVLNPLFNTRGEHVLLFLFGRPYTLEALCYGAGVGAILVITLLWFGCYNRVMTEDKFTTLFGSLAPSLSLLMVMVFRLIPGLQRKAKAITDARRAIGMGSENAPKKEKLRSAMTVMLSLTGWSLESGILTADSMRSRGYGTARRTHFHLYRMTASDWVVLAWMAFTAAVTLWGAANGSTAASYTPTLSFAPATPALAGYCLFLLTPTVIHLKEVLLCRIFISRI